MFTPYRQAPVFSYGAGITVLLLGSLAQGLAAGNVTAWGGGQILPPEGLANVVSISSSADHSLAAKSDGTVVAWGDNMNYQCAIPAGLSGVTKVAAGDFFSLALRND